MARNRLGGPRPVGVGSAGRHLGFLAGVLVAAAALGVFYRYLFDPPATRTLANFTRSIKYLVVPAKAGPRVTLATARRHLARGHFRHRYRLSPV